MNGEEKLKELLQEVEETTNFDILSEMKVILNKAYGEENNQILKPTIDTIKKQAEKINITPYLNEQLVGDGKNIKQFLVTNIWHALFYTVYIKFPKIEITDGTKKHTIKDLYVRFFVKPVGTVSPELYGIRGEVSRAELLHRYMHSHLRQFDPRSMHFSTFCLGAGEIGQVLAILATKFTTVNFLMLTMAIKNFVVWESKEGRPYLYINDLGKSGGNSTQYNYMTYLQELVTIDIITQMQQLTQDELFNILKWDVSPKSIRIIKTEALEKWITKKILNMTALFHTHGCSTNNVLTYKSTDGAYTLIREDRPTDIRYQKSPLFNFKGEDIKLKITQTDEEVKPDEQEKYPHPTLTEAICKELGSRLTKSALSNDGIRTGSAFANNRQVTEGNQLSVSASVV